jgi:integrase
MTEYFDFDYGEWTGDELTEMDTSNDVNEVEIKRHAPDLFMESRKERGVANKTIDAYDTVLSEYIQFLLAYRDEHPCNVDDEDIKAFNEHLKEGKKLASKRSNLGGDEWDISDKTREDRLTLLVSFYNWLVGQGVVSDNPAARVLEVLRSTGDIDKPDRDRPVRTIEEMTAFLKWIDHPLPRAWFVFLLKTGARRAEAVNTDLRDLHIDHPVYYSFIDEHNISLSKDVEDKPDSVYLMNSIDSGEVVRGEERQLGIKEGREDGRVVPLDKEHKTALLEYLLVRASPDPDQPCHPLFVKRIQPQKDTQRIYLGTIKKVFFKQLGEYGWYESGSSIDESVDNHYFRHYFTANHRHMDGVYDDYMPDGLIAYIRGDADSADTTRNETYKHDSWKRWGRTVEKPYLDSIYQFNVYD